MKDGSIAERGLRNSGYNGDNSPTCTIFSGGFPPSLLWVIYQIHIIRDYATTCLLVWGSTYIHVHTVARTAEERHGMDAN